MRLKLLTLVVAIYSQSLFAQTDSAGIGVGKKAPSFILNLQENTVKSFAMPHMKRIVLLFFWNSNIPTSVKSLKNYNWLVEQYQGAQFSMAESFEVIAVAVQTDRIAWAESIQKDSLQNITHGIAIRGYQDEVCKRYKINRVPQSVFIDENGIVLAINPRLAEVETMLDEKKNTKTLRREITGTLAQSSDKSEPLKYCKVYLFNTSGDSIQKTVTSDKGIFVFPDVKMNQGFSLKVDNKVNITTSDPIALYTSSGEFITDGKTQNNGFEFLIPARLSNKLAAADSASVMNYLGQVDIIKHLTFFTNGKGLTPKDEEDLAGIVKLLLNNKDLRIELTAHTDARMDKVYAKELTANQAETLRQFLEKKGINSQRIQVVSKGNSELRKICEGGVDCREEDHQLNRRVEFLLFRN